MEKCKHLYTAQFSGAPVCDLTAELCPVEVDGKECPVQDKNEDMTTCDICDFGNPRGCDFIYCGTQNGKSVEACLIPPTPISMRKNPERPASIQVLVSEDNGGYRQFDIPISHCPCCGRKL